MAADLTLILGLGESGLAMARWLARQGVALRVADSRERPPGVERLRAEAPAAEVVAGPFSDALLEGVTRIAISPGLDPRQPLVATARARGLTVVGEMDLFVQALRDLGVRDATRLIAITGTNGKTTTTTLAGEMVRACGVDGVVAGNISPAALDVLMARLDAGEALPAVWVLELSSFQLETTSSLKPDAATVLNISQDHMDRYANLDDYAVAKTRIFAGQGVQVLNRDDPAVMAMALEDRTQWTFGLTVNEALAPGQFGLATRKDRLWLCEGDEALLPVDKLPIAGLHNAANALAALALCRAIQLPYEGLIPALKTFEGLPHRVQKVAEVAGRTFYDDSKGTNVGATAAALLGFASPVVLIAGGDGKGQDFSPLRAAVGNARAVVQIGRDGPLIEAAIGGACPVHRAESMEEAVQLAFKLSRAGDAVLLSPACASWDMFRNYAHRAEVFIAAVKQLEAGGVS